MALLDALLKAKVKSSGIKKSDVSNLSKEEILKKMDADTIQLMAAMPSGVMDSVWKALGVEDGRAGKPESQ